MKWLLIIKILILFFFAISNVVLQNSPVSMWHVTTPNGVIGQSPVV